MDSLADIFAKTLALFLSLVMLAACPAEIQANADAQDGAAPLTS